MKTRLIDDVVWAKKISNLTVDLPKLENWLVTDVINGPFPEKIVYSEQSFYSGWTITSHNQEVSSGWEFVSGIRKIEDSDHPEEIWDADSPDSNIKGKLLLRGKKPGFIWDAVKAYENGYRPRWLFRHPTALCKGYVAQFIRKLEELGFYPRGAKVWKITPGNRLTPHTDGSKSDYCVRLHVPILTNDKCWHLNIERSERIHMPADGSVYLLRTEEMHDATNEGSSDRYHLVIDVFDTKDFVGGWFCPQSEIDKYELETEQFIENCERRLKGR